MSRVCCRDASSGTTPPHSRWIGTCDAMMLERIAHGFAASPVSSTTAADVSSQDVSMPRIFKSSFQRLDIWRPENAALGDDARDELMRCDVERRIPDTRT